MKKNSNFLMVLVFSFIGALAFYELIFKGASLIDERLKLAVPQSSEAATWVDIKKDWRSLPKSFDVASDEAVEHIYKSFFSLVEKGYDSELIRERIISFLNGLFLISRNDKIISSDKSYLVSEKENVKEIFGFLPNLSEEEWKIVWFRYFQSLADRAFDVVLGAPRYSVAVLLNSEDILPGISEPIVCAKIAKEHFILVHETGVDDADWRIRAYEDALSAHMHNLLHKKDKREYFLLLQEFFPYRLGTYPDFIEAYLSEVADFPGISRAEKEKFFSLVNQRIKNISGHRAAK